MVLDQRDPGVLGDVANKRGMRRGESPVQAPWETFSERFYTCFISTSYLGFVVSGAFTGGLGSRRNLTKFFASPIRTF